MIEVIAQLWDLQDKSSSFCRNGDVIGEETRAITEIITQLQKEI